MEVKKIEMVQETTNGKEIGAHGYRPAWFSSFVWQKNIINVTKTAIKSAQQSDHTLGHMLFSGSSWYGKTTLATIISNEMNVEIKTVTGYAISKPSELISILNNLQEWDVLFIDEIHRLKPNIEEVLYIAMEDRVIDFVMPEGGSMRLPINHFTLIGATTKLESLSTPLKNRFVYKFHFEDYTKNEIEEMVKRYLDTYSIKADKQIVEKISEKVEQTPREIHNLCIKIRDYLIAEGTNKDLCMESTKRNDFEHRLNIDAGGITPLHKKYLAILAENEDAVWVKTIAAKLWMNEKAIENDIEPLLLKLGKIEKTGKWRVLKN